MDNALKLRKLSQKNKEKGGVVCDTSVSFDFKGLSSKL